MCRRGPVTVRRARRRENVRGDGDNEFTGECPPREQFLLCEVQVWAKIHSSLQSARSWTQQSPCRQTGGAREVDLVHAGDCLEAVGLI